MSETTTRSLLSQEELDFLLAPTVAGDGDGAAMPADPALEETPAGGADGDGGAGDDAVDDAADGGADGDAACGGIGDGLQNIDGGALSERCFASLFERGLGRRSGAYVRLDLETAETRAWGAVMEELESPAWYVLLDAEELSSRLLFCMDERLTQALADASLGAGVKSLGARRLTSLDLALVRRLTADLPSCLTRAWSLTACTPRRELRRVRDIFLTEEEGLVRAAVYRMEVESAVGRCRLVWPSRPSRGRP